jgi:hypothetical protein
VSGPAFDTCVCGLKISADAQRAWEEALHYILYLADPNIWSNLPPRYLEALEIASWGLVGQRHGIDAAGPMHLCLHEWEWMRPQP